MSFQKKVFVFRDPKSKKIDAIVRYEDEIDYVNNRRRVRVPLIHLGSRDYYEANLGDAAISKALEEIQPIVEEECGKKYGIEDIHKRPAAKEDDPIRFYC